MDEKENEQLCKLIKCWLNTVALQTQTHKTKESYQEETYISSLIFPVILVCKTTKEIKRGGDKNGPVLFWAYK